MKRREFITAVGICSLSSLSGCLSKEPDDPVASPAVIDIWNWSGATFDAELAAEKDGTEVHRETYAIEAFEGTSMGGVVVTEDWMAEPTEFGFEIFVPEYSLEATWTTDDEILGYDSAYDGELEGECYYIRVEIGDGSGNPIPDEEPDFIGAMARRYAHDVQNRDGVTHCD